jgi:hypothetical protein
MAGETNISDPMRRSDWFRRSAAEIAELATRQHGVVERQHLIDLGAAPRTIDRWLEAGRLHRLYPSVYAVGHRHLSRQGWWMAAVLSGGPGTVLSHRPAGAAWNLREWHGRAAITVPKWRPGPGGIEIHSSSLPFDEVTTLDGIPITSMPRTLLDLATILDRHDLARAVEEAEHQQLSDPLSLPALLERHRGQRGAGKLRAVLRAAGYGKGVTRYPLEERFVRFLSEYRLPPPRAQRVASDRWPLLLARLPLANRAGDRRAAQRHVPWDDSCGHSRCKPRSAAAARRLAGRHVTWAQLHDRSERVALAADLGRVLV